MTLTVHLEVESIVCSHMERRGSYRDLLAWREAMSMVAIVYRETATFPSMEVFGLTNQLRRAAVSVASNIAEGAGRRSNGDFAQFLSIASGSLAEVETQLEIAVQLGYLAPESAAIAQAWRVELLLKRLRKSVVACDSSRRRPEDCPRPTATVRLSR